MNLDRRRFLGAVALAPVLTKLPANTGIRVTLTGKPPRWFASGGDVMRHFGWRLIDAHVVLCGVDMFHIPAPPAGVDVFIAYCRFERA